MKITQDRPTQGRATPSFCCFLTCKRKAVWEIWNGKEPYADNYTLACAKHVGELCEDAPIVNRVYEIPHS